MMNISKNGKTVVFLLVISCTSLFLGLTKADFLTNLLQQLQQYRKSNPHQQVYLHINQSAFQAGQQVWLKGYIIDQWSKKKSAYGHILHVKLLNSAGEIVRTLHLPVKNGISYGDFSLPDSLHAGRYRLVAYTNFMKNFDARYAFSQSIRIIHPHPDAVHATLAYRDSTYSSGDQIRPRVLFFNGNGKPVPDEPFTYRLLQNHRPLQGLPGHSQTDSTGNASFQFTLPALPGDSSLILQIASKDFENNFSWAVPVKDHRLNVQFFPEGGDLITGLKSRIAVKAVDQRGKPQPIRGQIVDQHGAVVANIETEHAGMGRFKFTPKIGKSYHLAIENPGGVSTKFPLPPSHGSGFALATSQPTPDSLTISVQSAGQPDSGAVATLIMNGKLLWANDLSPNFEETLPLDDFPTGIATITVFDNNRVPRAERLVFVNKKRKLNVNIKTDKKVYQPRGKVNMTISVSDKQGHPQPAQLSLSVIDDGQMGRSDHPVPDIDSYFLLTSELKGRIPTPNYYFKNDKPATDRALDMVMMINGWRRFPWQQILNGNFNTHPRLTENLHLSGRLVDKAGARVKNGKVIYFNPGNPSQVFKTTADDKGRFSFKHLTMSQVADSAFLQATASSSDRQPFIQINTETPKSSFDQAVKKHKMSDTDVQTYRLLNAKHKKSTVQADSTAILHSNRPDLTSPSVAATLHLKETLVEAKRMSKAAYKWEQQKRNSNIQVQQISGKKLRRETINGVNGNPGNIPQIIPMLRKITPVRRFTNHSSGCPGHVYLRGTSTINGCGGVIFYVDGIRIGGNAFELDYLTPQNINKIKVYKGVVGKNLFSFAPDGVVQIITRRPQTVSDKHKHTLLPNQQILSSYFSAPREFYAPSYATAHSSQNRSPDYRPTVYWNPSVSIGPSGKKEISFYTSDSQSTFHIRVEGYSTKRNRFISRKTTYQVVGKN